MRLAGLGVLAVAALIAAACGGGGDEPERVTIERLDLADLELSVNDVMEPPFGDQYLKVVATVNGEEITGLALASRQVMVEMGEWEMVVGSPDGFGLPEFAEIGSAEPLEALIDEALLMQAAERVGLVPSYEEAVALTREYQASFDRLDDQGAEAEDLIGRLGLPERDWATDSGLVELYRRSTALGELRYSYCDPATPGEALPTPSSGSFDCTRFLNEERSRAEIVYFVRWAE